MKIILEGAFLSDGEQVTCNVISVPSMGNTLRYRGKNHGILSVEEQSDMFKEPEIAAIVRVRQLED